MSEAVRSVLPKKSEPSAEGRDLLTRARAGLLIEYPFLGFLLMATEFEWTEDIPTLCATTMGDRNRVFINEECFGTQLKDDSERAFAIAHELCHIFFDHIDQCYNHNYNPKLWNIATDYFINGHLHNMKSKYMTLPTWVLYREDMLGKDSHTIYHELLEENNNDPEQAISNNGGGVAGDTSNDQGNGVPLDDVSVHKTSETHKTDNNQTVTAAVEAANKDEKSMGQGAGGLVREFAEFVTPKVHWSEELRDFVVETCKEDYTYSRPSRRSTPDIIFPSMDGEKIRICFGVDTSGSMSNDELRDAVSELKAIIDTYESWEVDLISCDTGAHVMGQYSSEEGDDISTIDLNLIGGGGTDMFPIVRYANEEMEDPPNVCIIVTDGFIPEDSLDNEIDEVPVLTIVTEQGNKDLNLENSRIIHMN